MKTRLELAKDMRAGGSTLKQIGEALVPPVSRQAVCQMLRGTNLCSFSRRPFDRIAPWLIQQLELARHRQYDRPGSLADWRAEAPKLSACSPSTEDIP